MGRMVYLFPRALKVQRYFVRPLNPEHVVRPANRRPRFFYRSAANAARKEAIRWAIESANPETVGFGVVRTSSIRTVEARGTKLGPVEDRSIRSSAERGHDLGQAQDVYAVSRNFWRFSRMVKVFGDRDEALEYLQSHVRPGFRRLSVDHQIRENVAMVTPLVYAETGTVDLKHALPTYDPGMRHKSTVQVHVPPERLARAVRLVA